MALIADRLPLVAGRIVGAGENTRTHAQQVGSHLSGAVPLEIRDLAGNASEWVADWYAEEFSRLAHRAP